MHWIWFELNQYAMDSSPLKLHLSSGSLMNSVPNKVRIVPPVAGPSRGETAVIMGSDRYLKGCTLFYFFKHSKYNGKIYKRQYFN